MSQPALQPPAAMPEAIDQRVRLHGISWADFEALLAARGDQPGVRVTYLCGELELMTPSVHHESLKTRLARIVEFYAEEIGIPLEGFGSWTLRSEARRRGAEADECYVIGPIDGDPELPDLAIEVVWTSGGIDKLEVYRGLGVPEVWIWQDGRLGFHLLRDGIYHQAARSAVLAQMDPALIVRCMAESSQTDAIRRLRSELAVWRSNDDPQPGDS